MLAARGSLLAARVTRWSDSLDAGAAGIDLDGRGCHPDMPGMPSPALRFRAPPERLYIQPMARPSRLTPHRYPMLPPDAAGAAPRRTTGDPDRFLIPRERVPEALLERIRAGGEAAPPLPAATVVVRRGSEVLLLRRPQRSGFAAGAWVFPGGRVDAGDADPALRSVLRGPPAEAWARGSRWTISMPRPGSSSRRCGRRSRRRASSWRRVTCRPTGWQGCGRRFWQEEAGFGELVRGWAPARCRRPRLHRPLGDPDPGAAALRHPLLPRLGAGGGGGRPARRRGAGGGAMAHAGRCRRGLRGRRPAHAPPHRPHPPRPGHGGPPRGRPTHPSPASSPRCGRRRRGWRSF
jgi:8-oxo-dGTP pyrophosphatase MutT (NUDIX family)